MLLTPYLHTGRRLAVGFRRARAPSRLLGRADGDALLFTFTVPVGAHLQTPTWSAPTLCDDLIRFQLCPVQLNCWGSCWLSRTSLAYGRDHPLMFAPRGRL